MPNNASDDSDFLAAIAKLDNGGQVKDDTTDAVYGKSLRGLSFKEEVLPEIADAYEEAVKHSLSKSSHIGGDSKVNYVPLGNEVVMRWDAKVKKSDLMLPKPEQIFEKTFDVVFSIAAYGPDVKNILVGDVVNIKNTSGLAMSRHIPHKHNIYLQRDKFSKDREAMISASIKDSEDVKRVGRTDKDIINTGTDGKPNLLSFNEETVDLVEHFITDNFNVCGVIYLVDGFHKS